MPKDDDGDSLFLQPATAHRDKVSAGRVGDPSNGPVLPRWRARFTPSSSTRLDFDALPSAAETAGMELAFRERALTDAEEKGNCSPRPVWHDRTRVGTMATLWVWAGRTDDGRRRYVPARSLGSVTVPGLAIARRVASARYPAGSTPASFADSSSV